MPYPKRVLFLGLAVDLVDVTIWGLMCLERGGGAYRCSGRWGLGVVCFDWKQTAVTVGALVVVMLP